MPVTLSRTTEALEQPPDTAAALYLEEALLALPPLLRHALVGRRGGPPDPVAVATALRDRALEAVTSIPPEQRRLLELRERHQLTYAQIAAETGRSVPEVEKLLLQARWRFRRVLEALCVPASGEAGCDWVLLRLAAAVDGELSPAKQAGVAQHVDACETCRWALQDAQGTAALYALVYLEDPSILAEQRAASSAAGPAHDSRPTGPISQLRQGGRRLVAVPVTGPRPSLPPRLGTLLRGLRPLLSARAPLRNLSGPVLRELRPLLSRRWRETLVVAALIVLTGASVWVMQGPLAKLGDSTQVSTPPVVGGAPPAPSLALGSSGAEGARGAEQTGSGSLAAATTTQAGEQTSAGNPSSAGTASARVAAAAPATTADTTGQGAAAQRAASPAPTAATGDARTAGGASTSLPVAGEWAIVRGDATPRTWKVAPSVALNLRAEPSTAASLLGMVPPNGQVELLGGAVSTAEADFYPVRITGGTLAWVAPPPDDIPAEARRTWVDVRHLQTQPHANAGGLPLRVGTPVRVLEQAQGSDGSGWVRVTTQIPGRGEVQGYLPTSTVARTSLP